MEPNPQLPAEFKIPTPAETPGFDVLLDGSDELAQGYEDYLDRTESRSNRKLYRILRAVTSLVVAVLVSLWVASLVIILFFDGFHYLGFELSDGIMLALVGSSTVSILALLHTIVRHLFPKNTE